MLFIAHVADTDTLSAQGMQTTAGLVYVSTAKKENV